MHPVQLVDQAPGHRPSSQPRAAGSVGAHQRSWERTEVAFLLPFVAEVAVQVPCLEVLPRTCSKGVSI